MPSQPQQASGTKTPERELSRSLSADRESSTNDKEPIETSRETLQLKISGDKDSRRFLEKESPRRNLEKDSPRRHLIDRESSRKEKESPRKQETVVIEAQEEEEASAKRPTFSPHVEVIGGIVDDFLDELMNDMDNEDHPEKEEAKAKEKESSSWETQSEDEENQTQTENEGNEAENDLKDSEPPTTTTAATMPPATITSETLKVTTTTVAMPVASLSTTRKPVLASSGVSPQQRTSSWNMVKRKPEDSGDSPVQRTNLFRGRSTMMSPRDSILVTTEREKEKQDSTTSTPASGTLSPAFSEDSTPKTSESISVEVSRNDNFDNVTSDETSNSAVNSKPSTPILSPTATPRIGDEDKVHEELGEQQHEHDAGMSMWRSS